jgi:hypothetical protein
LLESAFSEKLTFAIDPASKFAITLSDFGTYSGNREEIVELRFYDSNVQVGTTLFGHGCNADGGLASFSTINVGTPFDRVDVIAHEAWHNPPGAYNGNTGFLVSEIKGCPSTDSTCVTSLATVGKHLHERDDQLKVALVGTLHCKRASAGLVTCLIGFVATTS